jgi:serine/threonine protein kinase
VTDPWRAPPRGVESPLSGNQRYEIHRRLGERGMGMVYAGFDRHRQRPVALQFLRDPERGSLYRFKREFRATADLVHPNLVRLFDLGVLPNGVSSSPWNWSTAAVCAGTPPPSPRRRPQRTVPPFRCRSHSPMPRLPASPSARWPRCSPASPMALAFLHRAGKVRRDLKPSNVMVGTDGRPRVLDFREGSSEGRTCVSY